MSGNPSQIFSYVSYLETCRENAKLLDFLSLPFQTASAGGGVRAEKQRQDLERRWYKNHEVLEPEDTLWDHLDCGFGLFYSEKYYARLVGLKQQKPSFPTVLQWGIYWEGLELSHRFPSKVTHQTLERAVLGLAKLRSPIFSWVLIYSHFVLFLNFLL